MSEEWLRALVDDEPRSFAELEAHTGPLDADVEGKERFGLSRSGCPARSTAPA